MLATESNSRDAATDSQDINGDGELEIGLEGESLMLPGTVCQMNWIGSPGQEMEPASSRAEAALSIISDSSRVTHLFQFEH